MATDVSRRGRPHSHPACRARPSAAQECPRQLRGTGPGALPGSMSDKAHHWSADVFREMKARKIDTVCTIPDGGLTQLLKMIEAEKAMRLVTLTTEEEGIGIATGCWIAGGRPMIAMQS